MKIFLPRKKFLTQKIYLERFSLIRCFYSLSSRNDLCFIIYDVFIWNLKEKFCTNLSSQKYLEYLRSCYCRGDFSVIYFTTLIKIIFLKFPFYDVTCCVLQTQNWHLPPLTLIFLSTFILFLYFLHKTLRKMSSLRIFSPAVFLSRLKYMFQETNNPCRLYLKHGSIGQSMDIFGSYKWILLQELSAALCS